MYVLHRCDTGLHCAISHMHPSRIQALSQSAAAAACTTTALQLTRDRLLSYAIMHESMPPTAQDVTKHA
jgi:hypothetical protein